MGANREHKDSVFTSLFNDNESLLSLYNAISGGDLPLETPLVIATLTDVLFNKRRNDVAFALDDRVVILIEHQASINENMPMRLLIYLARVYEKLIDNDAIFKRKLLKIPKPDFIVLYNGIESFPDEKILRISDAYKEQPDSFPGVGGYLELEVRVLNINIGRNETIVKRSETLYGYVRFVGKVRENQKAGLDLASAITKAVKDCIAEGILADYLASHSSEVLNMLTNEWNDEQNREVAKQEGREEGREEGIDISAEIIPALIMKEPIEEIAVQYNVSVDKVKQLQSVLAMYVAEPYSDNTYL